MAEFKGTIRLEDGDSLETSLTVDRGRLLVAAGEYEIGNWPVKGLAMERRNGDFRFHVEGEELLIAVADPVGFFLTLGIDEEDSKGRRSKKPRGVKRLRRKPVSQPEPVSQPAPKVAVAAPAETPPVVPEIPIEPSPVEASPAAFAIPVKPAPVDIDIPMELFPVEASPEVAEIPVELFPVEASPAAFAIPVKPAPVDIDIPMELFPVEASPEVAEIPMELFPVKPAPVDIDIPVELFPVEVPPAVSRAPAEQSPPVLANEVAPPLAPEAPPAEASLEATNDQQSPGAVASLWSRLSWRSKLAGAGAIALVILGVIAPTLLALLFMLAGMATLFLAIAAKSEGGGTFLPPPFFATTAASVGGIALVLLAITIIAVT